MHDLRARIEEETTNEMSTSLPDGVELIDGGAFKCLLTLIGHCLGWKERDFM